MRKSDVETDAQDEQQEVVAPLGHLDRKLQVMPHAEMKMTPASSHSTTNDKATGSGKIVIVVCVVGILGVLGGIGTVMSMARAYHRSERAVRSDSEDVESSSATSPQRTRGSTDQPQHLNNDDDNNNSSSNHTNVNTGLPPIQTCRPITGTHTTTLSTTLPPYQHPSAVGELQQQSEEVIKGAHQQQ